MPLNIKLVSYPDKTSLKKHWENLLPTTLNWLEKKILPTKSVFHQKIKTDVRVWGM